ncbi:unnamed protein product [Closterium sp. NIES-54]
MSRGIMGFIDGIPGNLNNMSIPSMGSDVDPFKVAAGLAVAVGVAAIGGVAAAVTVGGIIVLREQGQFMLPWEDKPKAVRPAPLTVQQWRDCFEDATGRLKGGGETAIGRVRFGGCDAEIRAEVWPFLLGLYEAESTEAERAQLRAQRRVLYEEIRAIAARVAVIARQAEEEATRRMKEEEEREDKEEREREEREMKEGEERERDEREREEREEREGEESERGKSNEGGSSQEEVTSRVRGDNGGNADGSGSGNEDGNGSNGGENSGVGNASDDEFSDAVCVDSACASLSVSTESFVDVAREEAAHAAAADADAGGGSALEAADAPGALSGEAGEAEAVASAGAGAGEEADGSEGREASGGSCGGDGSNTADDEKEDDKDDDDGGGGDDDDDGDDASREQRQEHPLDCKIPECFRPRTSSSRGGAAGGGAGGEAGIGRGSTCGRGSGSLENFVTWQRIMRLDAVRMNAAWIPYSTQKAFPPEEALEAAAAAGLPEHGHLSPPQRLHAARLVAILEAYAVYDPEVGYCQGMSDLLSPFVALLEEDSEAFWCFVAFMQRGGVGSSDCSGVADSDGSGTTMSSTCCAGGGARHNFRTDERGIRRQLARVAALLRTADPPLYAHLEAVGAESCMFAYRCVVVLMRRELSFEHTMCLWEVMWADAAAAAAAANVARAAAAAAAPVTAAAAAPTSAAAAAASAAAAAGADAAAVGTVAEAGTEGVGNEAGKGGDSSGGTRSEAEAGEDCEWEKVEVEEAEDKGRGEGERKGEEGGEGERERWEWDDESAPLLDNGWGGAFGWAAADKSSSCSDATTTTAAAAGDTASSSSNSARNTCTGKASRDSSRDTIEDTLRDPHRDASRVSGSRRKKAWQECRPRPDFLLFVVAAILVSRREQVLCCQGLDEVLLLCNSLSGQLDVWELMHCARQLAARLP